MRQPRDLEGVAAVLADARRRGVCVTRTGAGMSFDAQAMGPEIMLSTALLDHIIVHDDAGPDLSGQGAALRCEVAASLRAQTAYAVVLPPW